MDAGRKISTKNHTPVHNTNLRFILSVGIFSVFVGKWSAYVEA